jgi:hypothetical protein
MTLAPEIVENSDRRLLRGPLHDWEGLQAAPRNTKFVEISLEAGV